MTEPDLKWTTMSHNGPLFADPYRPLPKNVALHYGDVQLFLNPTAEEVATLYAKFMNTETEVTEIFNVNFFKDFQRHLSRDLRARIDSFELIDFSRICSHFENLNRFRTKLMTPMLQEHYGYCLIDGKRRRVSQFTIDGPSLHSRIGPKYGMVKPRVMPEDVIINSQENGAPKPPDGHSWKGVIHDRSVDWLWCWTDVISGRIHYARATNIENAVTCRQRDLDKARRLKSRIENIRKLSRKEWSSESCFERQRSVAIYFIDRLGFQVFSDSKGNPKTASVCNLRVEDLVIAKHGTRVKNSFKLKNKDFNKNFVVHPNIFKNVHDFLNEKDANLMVFDELTSNDLKEYLESLMDGLTPKIFWICNACSFLQSRLKKFPADKPLKAHVEHYKKVLDKIYNFFDQKDGKSLSYLLSSLNMSSSAQRIRNITTRNYSQVSSPSSNNSFGSRPISQTKSNVSINRRTNPFRTNKQKKIMYSTLVFLDPRITIAWCINRNIPIKEIYRTPSLRQAIRWALSCNENYIF
ncbi:hypothetical protein KR074_010734 [Drosophila pseudoananassae]|nr:hypothetical protein KR074_010734 [Drosophila pseudoananassae]